MVENQYNPKESAEEGLSTDFAPHADGASALPDSNFGLQQSCSNLALQICKLAASLTRQVCKLETSERKRDSHQASNLSQVCGVKLFVNYSKNRVLTQPRIRTRDLPLPKPVALTTQLATL
ncbi:hypothetical protein AVEN_42431-1 [Araneus ventricosus]|uniref:Uncharacterized protein n=1 Tax=Araneus ventricosus TaxID=182803 RepID=A0A4Y2M4L9_ARAVE|nr:hypothetical protein AVEN_42431-1 [Araneus ventricosus]